MTAGMGGPGGFGHSLRQDASVADHRLTPGTTRRVLRYAAPYRFQITWFLLLVVLGALLVVATPLLLQRIIDDGVATGDRRLVVILAGLVALVAVAEAALTLLQRWFSARIGEGLIYDLRTDVFAHVQRQSIAFFTRSQTGSLVTRLNSDVIGAQRAFTSTLSGVVANLISVAVVLVTMVALSWQITLLALAVVPFLLLPARRVGRRLAGLNRRGMELNAELGNRMTERFNVGGALLVKLFGTPAREEADFAAKAAAVRDIGIRTAMSNRVFFAALGAMASLATALVYGLGGVLAIDGAVTVGTLVAFAGLLGRLYGPVTALSNVQVDVMSALVSFERVFEVLDLKPLVVDAPDAVDLPDGPLSVELDDVRFAYPSGARVALASLEGLPPADGGGGDGAVRTGRAGRGDGGIPDGTAAGREDGAVRTGPAGGGDGGIPDGVGARPGDGAVITAGAGLRGDDEEVLKGVSVRVEPGTMLALVGPSGAGKTTLSSLVARLYDPTAGAVRIGGLDLRQVRQASLHAAVGVVTQDAHLFHDTVRANLTYARPEATDEELYAALRAAHVEPLVRRLPQGLDTVVGDRGHRLSGGEKQRVAIARLLLRAPRVVVLDEATAHLDSESEAAVQLALDSAMAGRTSIVIAHRLSTVRRADAIAVLDAGRVVERGTHAELLARGGLYAELYETQFTQQDA
ncbi:ABC transporter ATP-binding protein/permease [Georgenia sp. TF02-10]|uniref:ABC transporter ATP-binding protein n=1 Tax=Georgenia sp. TF02-10 TaxID=2917725 RepID=UPI001FA6ACF8|nr:ABC transporter ATP-binding protein [Georgenia sp. TF02-10]UNX55577.1 ABC transporter ATP-binding protein/permease [Georgenia sp. TF02-10]